MYRTRGCSRDKCIHYRPASEKEGRKMVRSFEEGEVYSRPYFERPVKKAEPALEPPDTARYITAGCGHEVYEGEELFESEEEGTLCRECMEELVGEIPIRELAELLGCACVEVMFPAGCLEKD
jgi:hypothetical protein